MIGEPVTVKRGDLAGKVALIVGAASGIGRATTQVFAREGAQLILADVNTADGQALAQTLNHKTRTVFIAADVRQSQSVQTLVNQARKAFNHLDSVVISAGIEGTSASLHEVSEADFDQVNAVNLRGTFLVMKYTIPWLLEGGGGNIVNVASAAGMVGAGTMAAYCSAKGGVIQLARVAAIDYAMQGIRVNSVCPGCVDTPMMRRSLAKPSTAVEGVSTLEQMDNLVNRACDPHEVAEAILLLSGDRAPFILGSELVIDGGKLTR